MEPEKVVETEISGQYFQKCSELQTIATPFSLKNVPLQIERRDTESEFELLRALTETKRHKTKLRVNSIIENKKNRYPEQSICKRLPQIDEHSRIVLPETQGEESTYINANEIPICNQKRIIITQAPLQTTQADFELMLRQQRIDCVVMLCNIIENGKVRCFDYVGNREIETLKEVQDYLTVSRIRLHAEEEESGWVYTHIHYSEWPDRGLPEDIQHIRQLIGEVMQFDRIAIHCSAGLGRSGVLGSALMLELQAREGSKISVFEAVRRMREYRFGAVQNNEQYKFIYEYLRRLSTQVQ